MTVRRLMFRWLLPAAIVLPVWLLIGWGVFSAGGFTFLGVLLIGMPAVLVGELVIALLIRARPTVRAARAISWRDAWGITVWHGLVIAFGFYGPHTWGIILAFAVAAYAALLASSFAQLAEEARGGGLSWRGAGTGPADIPWHESTRERARQHGETIIVNEVGRPGDGRSTH